MKTCLAAETSKYMMRYGKIFLSQCLMVTGACSKPWSNSALFSTLICTVLPTFTFRVFKW